MSTAIARKAPAHLIPAQRRTSLSPVLSEGSSSYLSSPATAMTGPLTTPITTPTTSPVPHAVVVEDDDNISGDYIIDFNNGNYHDNYNYNYNNNGGGGGGGGGGNNASNSNSLGSFLAEVDEWLVNIGQCVAELESRHRKHLAIETGGWVGGTRERRRVGAEGHRAGAGVGMAMAMEKAGQGQGGKSDHFGYKASGGR